MPIKHLDAVDNVEKSAFSTDYNSNKHPHVKLRLSLRPVMHTYEFHLRQLIISACSLDMFAISMHIFLCLFLLLIELVSIYNFCMFAPFDYSSLYNTFHISMFDDSFNYQPPAGRLCIIDILLIGRFSTIRLYLIDFCGSLCFIVLVCVSVIA